MPVYDRGSLIERAVDNLHDTLCSSSRSSRSSARLPAASCVPRSSPSSRCRSACCWPSSRCAAGHQREHHVARRHRDRDRRDGRCADRAHRERAQASRARGAEKARRSSGRALARNRERLEGSRPGLFFSLLVIVVSYFAIFTLEAQEGGCSSRSRSRAAIRWRGGAAGDHGRAVTRGLLIRGRIVAEARNPVNRLLLAVHGPCSGLLRWPAVTILAASCCSVRPGIRRRSSARSSCRRSTRATCSTCRRRFRASRSRRRASCCSRPTGY